MDRPRSKFLNNAIPRTYMECKTVQKGKIYRKVPLPLAYEATALDYRLQPNKQSGPKLLILFVFVMTQISEQVSLVNVFESL